VTVLRLWEIHPVVLHFPLAFLLAAAAADLIAMRRHREALTRFAAGLFLLGVVMGWLTVAAGILAYFTVPHSDEAHELMLWHGGFASAAMLLFTWIGHVRWRQRSSVARPWQGVLLAVAAVLLIAAGWLGGHLVYRDGAGVQPETGHQHHH
jgi:uncharacterized membrane protein